MTLNDLLKDKALGKEQVRVTHKMLGPGNHFTVMYHHKGKYYGHYADNLAASFDENAPGWDLYADSIPKPPVIRRKYVYQKKQSVGVAIESDWLTDDQWEALKAAASPAWSIEVGQVTTPE